MNVARCTVCGGLIAPIGGYWVHLRAADRLNQPHEATPRKGDK